MHEHRHTFDTLALASSASESAEVGPKFWSGSDFGWNGSAVSP